MSTQISPVLTCSDRSMPGSARQMIVITPARERSVPTPCRRVTGVFASTREMMTMSTGIAEFRRRAFTAVVEWSPI